MRVVGLDCCPLPDSYSTIPVLCRRLPRKPSDVTGAGYGGCTAAIPESSSPAMMAFGIAGVGFMAYCRRSKPVLMVRLI